MAKKKKDRWTRLAEAAEELNEVLGLEPPIETTDVSEIDLEEKVSEAARMIVSEDEFTSKTEKVLAQFLEDDDQGEEIVQDGESWDEDEEEEFEDVEFEEEEEFEEEPEPEEAKPIEEATSLGEHRDEVESLSKRKYLRQYAQDNEDIFGPVVEKLPELKSSKALKGAMLSHLDDITGGAPEPEPEEEPEDTQDEAEEKPKKKKKGRGVIATIASTIEDSGDEGATKEEILEILTEKFPNRNPDSMSNTINIQVPYRISKERFNVERGDDGRYRKIEE